jgi:hypothetical protein
VELLIDPLEDTIRRTRLASGEQYRTVRTDVPPGVQWWVEHPALGSIGKVELLPGDSENLAEIFLTPYTITAYVMKEQLSEEALEMLGRVTLRNSQLGDAWADFAGELGRLFGLEIALRGVEVELPGSDLAQELSRYSAQQSRPPRATDNAQRHQRGEVPKQPTKRPGGRPKGSGEWSTLREFLEALRPVLRELAEQERISQDRAADRLKVAHATLRRYLRWLEQDQGITWEQLRNEAQGF